MLISLQTSIEPLSQFVNLTSAFVKFFTFLSNFRNISAFSLDTKRAAYTTKKHPLTTHGDQFLSLRSGGCCLAWINTLANRLNFWLHDHRVQSCIPLKSVVRRLLVWGQNLWWNMTSFIEDQ